MSVIALLSVNIASENLYCMYEIQNDYLTITCSEVVFLEKEIGKRIQEQRKRKGLTQEQVAEQVELSTGYYSAVERGMYTVSLDKLVDIMNVIGCTADDIFVDVLKTGSQIRASKLGEMLEALPEKDKNNILDVVQVMINNCKK